MKHKRQIDQQLQQQRQQQMERPSFKSALGYKSPPHVNIEPFNLSSKPPLSPPTKSFNKSDLSYSNDQNQQTSKQYYYEKYLINDESNITNGFNNFTLNDPDDLTEEKPVFSKPY